MIHPTKSDWEATPKWYDANSDLFIDRALNLAPSADLTDFISRLRPGAKVLDAGCGTGRDLKFFLSHAFDAHGLDASQSMVEHSRTLIGDPRRVRHLMLQDYRDAEGSWDAIWAMASLIHVPRKEIAVVAARLLSSLRPGGLLFANFKSGAKEIKDSENRAMTLLSEREALQIFLPLMGPNMRASVRSVEAKDSRGKWISWTTVLVRA